MPISTGPEPDETAGRTEPVRRWDRRKLLVASAGAVALAGGLAGVLLAPSGPAMAIGRPLPDFELRPIEGMPQSGFDQRATRTGATVVLNAFASWCVPCRDEHPMLVRLAREHGITVQGMNVQDLPEQAMEFLAELGNPYTRVGADPNRTVANRLSLVGLPHSFVLDGNGALRVSRPGPIDEHFLATVLNI